MRSFYQPRRGAALLLCMVFTAAVITPLTVLSLRAVGQVRHAEYGALAASALSTAEGALTMAEGRLRAGASGASGALGFSGEVTWNDQGQPRLPDFGSPGVTLQTLPGTPTVTWFTATATRPDLPSGYVIVYAFARAGTVERRVEAILRPTADTSYERLTWRELTPGTTGEAAR